MANIDVTRIAGNIGALNSLNSLQAINNQLAVHQTRLATGKKINEAADDPAGLSMATTFDVRRESMRTVLNSIGDAKNLLSTGEGGLRKIQDILVKMRSKALEAKGGTIGATEVDAIKLQLDAYAAEVDAIAGQTTWNTTGLIGSSGSAGAASGARNFLTDVQGGTTTLNLGQGFGAYGDGTDGLALLGAGATQTTIDTDGFSTTDLTGGTALTRIDAAIDKVKIGVSKIGSFSARLSFKEDAMNTAYTNTEAAYNRIMNANMAEEQVNASKFVILQQTATAMLAQANAAPQFLLSLFR
jgi:flagellin